MSSVGIARHPSQGSIAGRHQCVPQPVNFMDHSWRVPADAFSGSKLVSIGLGPYPEHGVGWEAGYRVAYFANRRIVAQTPSLPTDISHLMADVEMSSADAVLVWEKPADPSFQRVLRSLAAEYQTSLAIVDPALGQMGAVVAGRIAGNQVAAAESPVSHIGGR
jgi:hypothetical protein